MKNNGFKKNGETKPKGNKGKEFVVRCRRQMKTDICNEVICSLCPRTFKLNKEVGRKKVLYDRQNITTETSYLLQNILCGVEYLN